MEHPEKKQQKRYTVMWVAATAIFLAINIALSSFGVPVPGGHFYLNDIAICTGSILLDPLGAVIAGGLGAFLGDFFFYPAPMFVSLVVRGLQSLVISLCVRKLGAKHPKAGALTGLLLGAVIMVVGYSLGRAYVYSTPEYAVLKLPTQILMAALGVVSSYLLCYKAGLKHRFTQITGLH